MKRFLFILSLILLFSIMRISNVLANTEGNISFEIQMLDWDEVNQLLPKYSKFTVMDVETGIQFEVQRRAGSRHADVQPITSYDTKQMKKIYNGKWSWKRRAIIVMYNDQWIAASMHGMPHGAGALKNNFSGHFCIHFYGSTTHRHNYMDLSHKLMILKSAGKLKEYVKNADPYETIAVFITGLKQQDEGIVSTVSEQQKNWHRHMSKIENVKLINISKVPLENINKELVLEIPLEVSWYLAKVGEVNFRDKIYLYRFSPFEPWKVDAVKFLKDNQLYQTKK